jgi:hypothetical protein
MESALGFQTRRELIVQMIPRYRKASVSQKGARLDEIAATTGYARRYAMWLLNHPQKRQLPPRLVVGDNERSDQRSNMPFFSSGPRVAQRGVSQA